VRRCPYSTERVIGLAANIVVPVNYSGRNVMKMIMFVAGAALIALAVTEASAQSARRSTPRCPQSGYLNGKWYCNVTKQTGGQTANPTVSR
jgi:hypothetical protein